MQLSKPIQYLRPRVNTKVNNGVWEMVALGKYQQWGKLCMYWRRVKLSNANIAVVLKLLRNKN